MDWKCNGKELTRSALGRKVSVGELYNIWTETPSGRSVLKSSFPSTLIQKDDISRTELNYKLTENFSDRFNLLNVEGELQVSILCNLIEVEGCGKFLTDEKKSNKTVSCSLVCKFYTVCEKISKAFDTIQEYINPAVLEDSQNTHVVVEVNWGANCLLNIETFRKSNSEKKDIENSLKAEMSEIENLLNVKIGGNLKKKDDSVWLSNNISIKVCADVISKKGLPTSIKSFHELLVEIPDLLKNVNEGKGQPLSYVLVPLSSFLGTVKLKGNTEIAVKSIDEGFLALALWLFEDLAIIKQRFYDLIQEMEGYPDYICNEDLQKVKEQKESLKLKESTLKSEVADWWKNIRSGQNSLKDFARQMDIFKNKTLNLNFYEQFIDSYSSIRGRLTAIQNFKSSGVHYLGKNEKFENLTIQHLSSEFIVLVISSEMEKENPVLCLNTRQLFLDLIKEHRPNTIYVVVDLDLAVCDSLNNEINNKYFLNVQVNTPKCFHLKGTNILSSDLYYDHFVAPDKNFVQLKQEKKMENVHHRSKQRVFIEITCPGNQSGLCSLDKLKWFCFQCKTEIEYGFDDYFYCFCGKGKSIDFEFRCCDPKHGTSFVSSNVQFLKEQLGALKPFKDLNVLILGQTGVGKSTWINSIINYLNYDTLKEAQESGVLYEIPISIALYDSNTLKKHVVRIGESDNEETAPGQSSTQFCRTYNFLWEDRCVRLIDTPGIGDTRGIDQDKKNMRNILDHIGYLKELHAVCILLKANENRMNVIFSYCIKELLTHLHKNVVKNIIFCFTHSRNSFYTPGEASVLLEYLFQTMEVESNFELSYSKRFCLDNEAFMFLCSLNNPEINFDKSLKESFEKSWQISLEETKRMFDTIKNLEPHRLKETLSLVNSRNRILSLTKPVAEISKTIQINLAAIEKKKEEINNFNKTIEDLAKKLKFTAYYLEVEEIDYPRTVCTSPKCIKYLKYENLDVTEVEYATLCHDRCFLENVEPKTKNNSELKKCKAMKNDICQVCGCEWQSHMHITFTQKRVEKELINKKIENEIEKEKLKKENIEEFIRDLEIITDKYKQEQEFIIKTSVKLGMFLKKNAISVYNDSVADYLEYLIQTEENKVFKSKTEEKILKNLKETLKHYEAEVEILQKVVNESSENSLTVEEVLNLEQQLYSLKLTGGEIKASVEANRKANSQASQYTETPLKINKLQKRHKIIHRSPKLKIPKPW